MKLLALLSLVLVIIAITTSCGGAKPTVGDPELGKAVVEQNGCLACHTTDGPTLVGPTWQGLYGKTESFEDGSTLTVDHAYLEESITNPGAKVVKGFTNVMPPIPLNDDEIDDVIAYIRSLK